MQIKPLTPRQSISKAFLKEKILRSDIQCFKQNLSKMFDTIDHDEREENTKTILRDFLNNIYYQNKHHINTLRDIDLVIFLENNQNKAAVLTEVKRPKNKSEMITKDNLNAKAMHELIRYYLEERIDFKNNDIKYLIATNIYEWFIFDAMLFENLFYKNKALVKDYESWRDKQKTSGNTDLFYNEISKPFLASLSSEVSFTYFNFNDYKKELAKEYSDADKQLIALYKILSPVHLLKQPFSNDSNSLDRNFYNELLHIIGLVEIKDKNKKLISRKPEKERDSGSIIENAIVILDTDNTLSRIKDVAKYGAHKQERLFNLALELSITWINRILFLKLLEAQLYKYHKDEKHKFLNKNLVKDFDELYKLFHQVLAVPTKDRSDSINKKFAFVPYLNSSLFEISDLESETLKVNSLDDNTPLELYKNTVLKDKFGKKKTESIPLLHYLFEFLDAYDFTSEGNEEIQDDKKTLINASVLGLIFEKINGYKDSSFFTPGFITMYMCRETLSSSVVQKFNEKFSWNCETLIDLKNHLASKRNAKDILESNSVINSIKICDPAVGSGHFLVSALNELIAIKSELGILADSNGELLSGYEAHVDNDELIITYNNGEDIFEYHPPFSSISVTRRGTEGVVQRVQQTLFTEKQTIIENSLFGVDINPNSVKIARLRLWIELLKNAYYTKESNYTELETLPNIDINIKEGNSLISRFALDADLKSALKTIRYTIDDYKNFVRSYKNTNDKEQKSNFRKFIDDIKSNFRTEISKNDPRQKKLSNLAYELHNKFRTERLFGNEGLSEKDIEKLKKEEAKLEKEINKLSLELEEEQSNAIYNNAFEWRFEFPEVLDNEGNFIGFDVVIGNPPYISNWTLSEEDKELVKFLENLYSQYLSGHWDLFNCFVPKAFSLLKHNGYNSFIVPTSFFKEKHSTVSRNFLISKTEMVSLIDFGEEIVFEDVARQVGIFIIRNNISPLNLVKVQYKSNGPVNYIDQKFYNKLKNNAFKLNVTNSDIRIFEKMNSDSILLGKYVCINTGVVAHSKLSSPLKFTKDDVIHNVYKDGFKKYIIGANLTQYSVEYLNHYIDYDSKYEYFHRPKYKPLFESPKIIVRRISGKNNSILATYDKNNYYSNDNLMHLVKWNDEILKHQQPENKWTIIKDSEIDLKYLLAILTSKLSTYFFSKYLSTDTLQGSYSSIYPEDLRQIPVKIDSKIEKEIVDNVDQIILQKSNNHYADVTNQMNIIDKLVYQLYGLTEEEIKIVEGNT